MHIISIRKREGRRLNSAEWQDLIKEINDMFIRHYIKGKLLSGMKGKQDKLIGWFDYKKEEAKYYDIEKKP